MKVLDLRVSAVTTKQEVDVPANVNQDEAEMTLEECFVNPLFRQSAEFAKSTACFKHKTAQVQPKHKPNDICWEQRAKVPNKKANQ